MLANLAKKALEKHQSTIIAVMGDGQTSIAREITYQLLKNNFPVRRNIESPEAELSIPLTVLGYPKYPTNYFEWFKVILKNYFSLKKQISYHHYLILELNFVDPNLLDFWLMLLKPETVLIVGNVPLDYSNYDFKKIVKITSVPNQDILGSFKIAAKQIGRFYGISSEEIDKAIDTFSLPEAKIRYFPGENHSTIIDATHLYFPINLEAVLDLVENEKENSRVVVFTGNKDDLKKIKNKNFLVNPPNYRPQENDTIVIRGERSKVLAKLEYLFTSTKPLF